MNFLEQLIAEWYEYKGYFVKRNIKIGKRAKGGYETEIDIVAFNPKTNHLIHLEPSSDTDSWKIREERYEKKFRIAKTYIPEIFEGIKIPSIEQVAVFLNGAKSKDVIGGGKVVLMSEIMSEIKSTLEKKSIMNEIVPESYPLIRTIHIFIATTKNNKTA